MQIGAGAARVVTRAAAKKAKLVTRGVKVQPPGVGKLPQPNLDKLKQAINSIFKNNPGLETLRMPSVRVMSRAMEEVRIPNFKQNFHNEEARQEYLNSPAQWEIVPKGYTVIMQPTGNDVAGKVETSRKLFEMIEKGITSTKQIEDIVKSGLLDDEIYASEDPKMIGKEKKRNFEGEPISGNDNAVLNSRNNEKPEPLVRIESNSPFAIPAEGGVNIEDAVKEGDVYVMYAAPENVYDDNWNVKSQVIKPIHPSALEKTYRGPRQKDESPTGTPEPINGKGLPILKLSDLI